MSATVSPKGEEAVIRLVEGLEKKIDELEKRLKELEKQIKKDSKNSSKPPSSDGFGKRTKSLRSKSERESGGQKGHEGKTLEWREEVDEIVVHGVDSCEGCGASLTDSEVLSWDLRQVHDLPPLKLEVTEHRAEVKSCQHCGMTNSGKFPADVSNVVQYGSGVRGLMVYLMDGQLLPSERVRELLSEVFGCDLSEGTLYNTRTECYEQLEAVKQHLKESIKDEEVAHFDETGMRVTFERCFQEWVNSLVQNLGLQVIAIDGKTSRGSYDREKGIKALHTVSAWANEQRLVLGQVKVADKSNEITAIPALLELLDLAGCIITIDAMGTQTAIAKQIRQDNAEYLLCLKGNQGKLHQQIKDWFATAMAQDFAGIDVSFSEQVGLSLFFCILTGYTFGSFFCTFFYPEKLLKHALNRGNLRSSSQIPKFRLMDNIQHSGIP